MPLVGTLTTMPLPDLLQWLGSAGKTGTLRVERDKVCKFVRMREGRVIGCSSDDPAQRLGHFLVSRNMIDEEQLTEALTRQQAEDGSSVLGTVLVEMGLLTEEQLLRELANKAEEIIYSLFDWDHGTFRFEHVLEDAAALFPVDLRVEDIMLRGVHRHDEMARIRAVFSDAYIVLRYTSKPPGPEIFADEKLRTMYGTIDGERSIAEILLHVHGSEYKVQRFLFELHENGYVEIAGHKKPEPLPSPTVAPVLAAPEMPAVASPAAAAAPTPVAATSPDRPPELVPEPELEFDPDFLGASELATASPTAVAEPPGAAPAVPRTDARASLALAGQCMADNDYERALDILDVLYAATPGDEALRKLTVEAETAFIEKAYRHFLPADHVPILIRPIDELSAEPLTPHECFLLSRIDGTWNVKSIIQLAPFREVEALRTLKRMREAGMIELSDAT